MDKQETGAQESAPTGDSPPHDANRASGFHANRPQSGPADARRASWVTRNTPVGIPAILLGMLAVDSAYGGKGLGSALLQDAVIRSRFVAENIGAKVIVVDPLTPDSALRAKELRQLTSTAIQKQSRFHESIHDVACRPSGALHPDEPFIRKLPEQAQALVLAKSGRG